MNHETEVKREAPNPHNAPDEIWLGLRGKSWEWDGCWNIRPFPINTNMVVERYIRADLLATVRREEREAALNESAESIINEAGKVGQLMDLASASARKEERAAITSTLQDYFRHFPCTCVGQPRTGGHFAVCPITIRDEVLGRLAGLEASASEKGEMNG